jgi:hypothetical protein
MNDAAAVIERARTLVAWLNGALGVVGGTELLAIRDVGRIDNDGSIGFFNFASANIAGRGNMLAGAAVAGNPNVATAPVPARPSFVQRLMGAAEKDDDVASALKHFGQPTNWYDLWTAYEIIEDDLFQSTLQGTKVISSKRALMMSRKWVPQSDLKRFAQSCNYHRHGARKPPTPDQSATRVEARQILAQILRSWLALKMP